MAKDQTKVVSPANLKADDDALAALKGMAGYASAKPEFELAQITEADEELTAATEEYVQTEAKLKTARDRLVRAQWARHNKLLGAKQQVVAKFGDDSDEAQAIGLKKKSEYAKPSPSKKSKATGNKPA